MRQESGGLGGRSGIGCEPRRKSESAHSNLGLTNSNKVTLRKDRGNQKMQHPIKRIIDQVRRAHQESSIALFKESSP
jgi:hypothetical protein